MLYPQTERQQRFLAIARELADKFAERATDHDRTGQFPMQNYVDAKAVGLPALIIPEEYDGWGANLLDTVMTMEALAIGDGSTALNLTMHMQIMGAIAEKRSWPEPLFAQICRESVSKGALINSVASERELGSPSRGGKPKTTATPVGHNGQGTGTNSSQLWSINGRKIFASMSPALDYMIIPATLEDGSDQVARFVVPTDQGIEIVETWDALGMRTTGSHDVVLTDVLVPESNIIGRSGSAAPSDGTKVNAWFMLTVGAVYIGVAVAAHQAAIRFAKERVPTGLGKSIAETESIQRRLGQTELLLRQARVLLYQCADMWDQHPRRQGEMTASVATAKYTATNNAIAAVDHAMRVVGGAAMSKALPIERYYRDVRGGLTHPMNDDVALVTLGRLAIAEAERTIS